MLNFTRSLCAVVVLATGLMPAAAGSRADEKYVIGPDDLVLLRSAEVKEVDEKRFSVSKDGKLDLPVAGSIDAAGMPLAELRSQIEALFGKYYHAPRVSVEVAEFRSQPVSVLGSVTKPGVYQLQGRRSLAEVISMAGGLSADAGYSVLVVRKDAAGAEQSTAYSVSEFLRGEAGTDVPVQPYDVITVPKAALVYVIGDVRKPGGFTLADKERASVLQALALAEGALPTASLKRCTILKPQKNSAERTRIAVDLRRLINGKSPDMLLEAGDVLVVPSSTVRKASLKAVETALQTASGIVIWRRP